MPWRGRNDRNTDAYAFTRNDGDRCRKTSWWLYSRITSEIADNSVAAGFKTKTNSGWNIEVIRWKKTNLITIKGTINGKFTR
jgi:iron complex outermembrane receptor protein